PGRTGGTRCCCLTCCMEAHPWCASTQQVPVAAANRRSLLYISSLPLIEKIIRRQSLDFDPNNLQLRPEQVAQWTAKAAGSRRPSHQLGHFVKGPIPLAWLGSAAGLPGKALAVGLAIWFQRGLKKCETVTLTGPILHQFGVDRHAKYRALTALEKAGLV